MCREILTELRELGGKQLLTPLDKARIEELYSQVLKKKFKKTSCSDCYKDSAIEMFLFLKKYGEMKKECLYQLKNGALIQMGFGSSEMYTNENLTDEVAEQYLAKFPNKKNLFAKLPEDFETRVKYRGEGFVEKIADKLSQGESEDSIISEYRGTVVEGKRLTAKILAGYIKEAKEML